LTVVAGFIGDDGNRVWASVVAAKIVNLGKRRMRRKTRRLFGKHGSLPLLAQGLLLGKGLLLLAHLAS
jgi:hypothetical protein